MPARRLPRREFLATVGGGLGALGLGLVGMSACGGGGSETGLVRPGTASGVLRAEPLSLDLGGTFVSTWAYNGTVPGPEIRLRQGDSVRVTLRNRLPDPTTVHWHGIALPNGMDGVPDLTQPAVARGDTFDYEFVVPDPGSFMYHAHVGHQLDRGLYGPLIVEPRTESLTYDREYTVMLDDWRDGPDPAGHDHDADSDDSAAIPADANPGPKMGGRRYPLMLVNGGPPRDPRVFEVRRGDRIRLRVMNIAADTGFLFAVDGHRMTITHTDGSPVEPVDVDVLRLGMGERYDVLVHATNPGAWQIAALPEAKRGYGRAILRYTDAPGSAAPPPDLRPAELGGRIAAYPDMVTVDGREFPSREPDRVHDLVLTTDQVNGKRFPDAEPLPVASGEWVRVTMRNDSVMAHPMHLHGHAFRVVTPAGRGPVKDTMVVASGETAGFEFRSDNPGQWLFHCHNHYHMDKGMARVVSYA